MDKKIHNNEKKIILYPGLVKRLIEKGMDALKDKDANAAYQFFLTAEEHEPNHPQVLFGKILSLVQLGKLEEAVEHTTEILHQGIGDYYENLQVHISLLVQIGRYEEVVQILDVVLSENRIPSQYAESFYHLLHFSRQMVRNEELTNNHSTEPTVDQDFIHMLRSNSIDKQSKAIHQLRSIVHPDIIEAFIEFVERKDCDFVLQSMALQALAEQGCEKPVHITKLGKEQTVVPIDIDEESLQQFSNEINEKLRETIEHENPLLCELSIHIHMAHMYTIYPFKLEPARVELWTDVFLYCAAERLGLTQLLDSLNEKNDELLMIKVEEVKSVEGSMNFLHSVQEKED